MKRSIWQSILALLNSPPAPYTPAAEPFFRLDRDAVRAELQPAVRGASAGAQNLPPADAVAPDSREGEFSRFFQSELDKAFVQLTKGVDTHLASIRHLSSSTPRAEISELRDAALSQLNAVATQRKNEIEITFRHVNSLETAFEQFRKAHRREALPDLSRGGYLSVVLLFLMVAVETAFNGSLFAQGSDFGIVGGVFQAATFATANVVSGVVAGLAMRQLSHIAIWRKIMFGAATLALAGLAFAWNLGVAHVREAMVGGLNETGAARFALNQLAEGNYALGDLTGWLLLVMGYTFFWCASVDVYQMKDPYPGYAGKYETLISAKREYSDAVAETHAALGQVRDQFLSRITDVARQRDAWAHHIPSLHDHIARLANSYEQHCSDVKACYRQVIEEYRDANRQKRSAAPPAYFGAVQELTSKPVPVFSAPEPPGDVADSAAAAVKEVTAAHDAAINSLVPVSQLGEATDANS